MGDGTDGRGEVLRTAPPDMSAHEFIAILSRPFRGEQVRTRPQGGQQLPYVTARTVMNRLDEVAGPDNWWDEYEPVGENAVICRLSIRFPSGDVVTKADVGGMSKTQDPSDSEKAGFSDAFKRAAVKFGIARYLYNDGVPDFVREIVNARVAAKRAALGGPR